MEFVTKVKENVITKSIRKEVISIDKFKCPKCGINGNRFNPYETYNQSSMEISIDDGHGFRKGGGELLYKCPNCDCIICITVEFDCKITSFKVDDVTDIIKEY